MIPESKFHPAGITLREIYLLPVPDEMDNRRNVRNRADKIRGSNHVPTVELVPEAKLNGGIRFMRAKGCRGFTPLSASID